MFEGLGLLSSSQKSGNAKTEAHHGCRLRNHISVVDLGPVVRRGTGRGDGDVCQNRRTDPAKETILASRERSPLGGRIA